MIIPLEYEELQMRPEKFSGGLYLIAGKGGKYGVFGRDGKLTIPIQYDSITCVTNELVITLKNKKKKLLKVDGSTADPVEYDEITWLNRYFLLKKADKYGIADWNGAFTIPLDFENLTIIRPARRAIALFVFASKKGKKGIVNMEDGRIILPFEYDEIKYLNTQLVIACKGKKYGIIDFYDGNKVVLPLEYKSIKYQNKIITAEKNGYEKYKIDGNGSTLLKAGK